VCACVRVVSVVCKFPEPSESSIYRQDSRETRETKNLCAGEDQQQFTGLDCIDRDHTRCGPFAYNVFPIIYEILSFTS
jgi:hypothetical protein